MQLPVVKNLLKIPTAIKAPMGKLLFKTKKIRPEIRLGLTIALNAVAVAGTIIETWKGKDVIQNDISKVKEWKEYEPEKALAANPNAIIISEEERLKLLQNARIALFVDILKHSWKPGLCWIASIGLGIYNHKDLRKQLMTVSAMYAGLMADFKEYRARVRNDVGAEKEQEYAYGIKMVDAVDSETGEITKKPLPFSDMKTPGSKYARWLNAGIWDNDKNRWIWANPVYSANKLELQYRIRSIQDSCNDILRMQGWLTLNEVYKKLGLPQTEEGQHVGWVKGGFVDGHAGDDFVDFGVFPLANGDTRYQIPINTLFLDPESDQKYPLLDFNVICLDEIWNNIYEYDNNSYIVYDERGRAGGYRNSKEAYDRFMLTM